MESEKIQIINQNKESKENDYQQKVVEKIEDWLKLEDQKNIPQKSRHDHLKKIWSRFEAIISEFSQKLDNTIKIDVLVHIN